MDRKKAFDMLIKIDKETNGFQWAQYELGSCYETNWGASKDTKKAFEYYSLSAEQGNSLAMSRLGYCYLRRYHFGTGTDLNYTKAF